MRQDGIQKKERLISYKYAFNRVKVYGPDLKVLQNKALKINNAFADVPRFTGLTAVRELGQPRVLIDIDGEKIACHGINVSGLEAVIQAGVGGQAARRPAGLEGIGICQATREASPRRLRPIVTSCHR